MAPQMSTNETPRWLIPLTRLFGLVLMVGGARMVLIDGDWIGAFVGVLGCALIWQPDQAHTWLEKLIDKLPGGP